MSVIHRVGKQSFVCRKKVELGRLGALENCSLPDLTSLIKNYFRDLQTPLSGYVDEYEVRILGLCDIRRYLVTKTQKIYIVSTASMVLHVHACNLEFITFA